MIASWHPVSLRETALRPPNVAGQLSRAKEADPGGVGVEGEHLSLRGALELEQGVVGDQCGQPGPGGGATVVAQRPIP